MSDLSLVLESFSLVEIVAFYKFCNFVAKVQIIYETTKLFRDYFSKKSQISYIWNIFYRNGRKSASKRLYRRVSDPRAASSNISGREPQLLSILSVSRLPVGAPFSHLVFLLCFYRYIVPLKQGDFLTFSVSHL